MRTVQLSPLPVFHSFVNKTTFGETTQNFSPSQLQVPPSDIDGTGDTFQKRFTPPASQPRGTGRITDFCRTIFGRELPWQGGL